MDSEVLALLVRAKDEASAEFKKVEGALHNLNEKAKLTERGMGALHDVMKGIGMGIGLSIFTDLEGSFSRLVNLIPSLIEKGLTFADTVVKIQVATGASAETSSQFAGQLSYLGISTDNLTVKLGAMAKGIKAHEDELTKLGVSIRDANGNYLDTITIVNRARDAMNGLSDGIAKTTLARDLFGRTGAGMLEWLNLSAAQTATLNEKLGALGVTMSQKVVEEARAAGRESNLLNLAMQGLGNTIMANVVPQITVAIDSIVNFVQQNGRAIAKFASDVVNFVLGMISALTGATASLVPFTATMDGLAPKVSENQRQINDLNAQLDGLKTKSTGATGASAAHTSAIKEQTSAIDQQITALKAEAAAYDLVESQSMRALNAQVQGQLDALGAAAKAHSLDEQRAALASQMAAATTPAQVAQIAQQQADLEQGVKDDARRAELGKVTNFLNALGVQEKETVNKAKLLAIEKAQALDLQSQIAAAAAKGDLQSVADLSIELQGVQTTAVRTQAEIRNGHAVSELEAKKASLKQQTAAVGGAVADQTAIVRAGILKNIAELEKSDAADKKTAALKAQYLGETSMQSVAVYGPGPTGVAGLLSAAGLAGEAWGTKMRDEIGKMIDAMQKLFDLIIKIIGALDTASLGVKFLTDKATQEKVKQGGGIPILSGALDLLGGAGDLLGGLGDAYSNARGGKLGHAAGGWVGLSGPEVGMVGERGPEYIVPNGGGTGGNATLNIHPGAIVVNGTQDPQATARELMLAIKRELTRQGTSFSSGY